MRHAPGTRTRVAITSYSVRRSRTPTVLVRGTGTVLYAVSVHLQHAAGKLHLPYCTPRWLGIVRYDNIGIEEDCSLYCRFERERA